MRTELAKQLLKNIIEPIYGLDETKSEKIFKELHFFSEFKYDHYEMFAPGRHFLEHLYIWLNQFDREDQKTALEFVLNKLIYYSRGEFELLSRMLYWNIVRANQLKITSQLTGIPAYKVAKLANSTEFKNIQRRSLFVGMSDGARIDYFRRQHTAIGNEQVLSSYHVDADKCKDMIVNLEKDCGKGAKFKLLFLIDDFCASGTTLIRYKPEIDDLAGTLKQLENKTLQLQNGLDEGGIHGERKLLDYLLTPDCIIYLCPLLATNKSVNHIDSLKKDLKSNLKNINLSPASILDENLPLSDKSSELGKLCKKYYQERMGDNHTKDVTFGYSECGLPVVLHHNTPNNSLYILWNRRAADPSGDNPAFSPLFKRIERHKIYRED